MNTISRKYDQITKSLEDKEYRDAFVEARIEELIAAQIKMIREDRGLTQKELSVLADIAQGTVSLLENPNYGKYTLRTLRRLASVFDVGLLVQFVPFSELAGRDSRMSSGDLQVPSYGMERGGPSDGGAT